MAKNNNFSITGFLGKKEYAKEGTGQYGRWYRQSVAVFASKDKETQKNKYDNIAFFVPEDQIESIKKLEDGTLLKLTGQYSSSDFTDRNGVKRNSIQIDISEGSWEVVERENPQQQPAKEFSEDPF